REAAVQPQPASAEPWLHPRPAGAGAGGLVTGRLGAGRRFHGRARVDLRLAGAGGHPGRARLFNALSRRAWRDSVLSRRLFASDSASGVMRPCRVLETTLSSAKDILVHGPFLNSALISKDIPRWLARRNHFGAYGLHSIICKGSFGIT